MGLCCVLDHALGERRRRRRLARFDLEVMLRAMEAHGVARRSWRRRCWPRSPTIRSSRLRPLARCALSAAAGRRGAALERAAAERLGMPRRPGLRHHRGAPLVAVARLPRRRGCGVGGLGRPDPRAPRRRRRGRRGLGARPAADRGYRDDPEATAATIDADGWLHTGDLGHVDEDGHVFLVDRLKELIKVRGFQVAPAELEAVLVTHPAVADAAVIGVPDERDGERPKAFVVSRGPLDREELSAYVAERVAPYKRLAAIEESTSCQGRLTGKLLRRV